MILYDYLDSGNGYKVRLLLAQLGRAYRWEEVDIMRGGTRTATFLAKNPNARIPTLELDDGTCLAESNPILWYLSPMTAPTCPRASSSVRRRCNGCSSSNTVTSHTSRHRVSS